VPMPVEVAATRRGGSTTAEIALLVRGVHNMKAEATTAPRRCAEHSGAGAHASDVVLVLWSTADAVVQVATAVAEPAAVTGEDEGVQLGRGDIVEDEEKRVGRAGEQRAGGG